MLFTHIKNSLKTTALFYKIFDSIIYSKLRSSKNYNERLKEIEFYNNALGSKIALIFDVGANVGNKSIVFSKIAEKIVLFEPDINNIKILKARFKNKSNLQIVDCALSYQNGEAEYYAISDDSAYNSLSEKHMSTVVKNRNIVNKNNKLIKYKVKTSTLSFFIEKYGNPDYIKIDVEGFEKEVLFGLDRIVPLISFEANLPEFLSETLDIIDYLVSLSKDSYLYNYSTDNKLELNRYITSLDFKNLLSNLNCRSLEVYCQNLNFEVVPDCF